jgi:hypothetical protein
MSKAMSVVRPGSFVNGGVFRFSTAQVPADGDALGLRRDVFAFGHGVSISRVATFALD